MRKLDDPARINHESIILGCVTFIVDTFKSLALATVIYMRKASLKISQKSRAMNAQLATYGCPSTTLSGRSVPKAKTVQAKHGPENDVSGFGIYLFGTYLFIFVYLQETLMSVFPGKVECQNLYVDQLAMRLIPFSAASPESVRSNSLDLNSTLCVTGAPGSRAKRPARYLSRGYMCTILSNSHFSIVQPSMTCLFLGRFRAKRPLHKTLGFFVTSMLVSQKTSEDFEKNGPICSAICSCSPLLVSIV